MKRAVLLSLFVSSGLGAVAAPGGAAPARSQPSSPPAHVQLPRKGGGYYYGRETALPLCTWPGLAPFVFEQGENLTCIGPGGGDDSCHFDGLIATDDTYIIAPRDQPHNWTEVIDWRDGTVLRRFWSIRCEQGDVGGGVDVIAGSTVEGDFIDPLQKCGWPGPPTVLDVSLAEIAGGIVEHIRPGFVRGTVTIALPPTGMGRVPNDLVLALQAFDPVTGWHDVAAKTGTVELQAKTFEVRATVDALSDVRLQVRAKWRCRDEWRGAGYNLLDARIFVETCIPDQTQPDQCLGD